MKAYWITFTDGSQQCCEAQSVSDAKSIAEKLTGKDVKSRLGIEKPSRWDGKDYMIECLPYPANPRIWAFDHPVHGRHPSFCFRPKECAGKSACPRVPSCCS